MELNFDKEIDAILRKAQGGEAAFAANLPAHLDADDISAFAENALPESAKTRYTAHLADCERCRKILSNVILLNAETKSEIVHAEEKAVVAPVVPWYRRLLQFPNLAYSLGALTVVFGAMIAFIVLQGPGGFLNSEVSQVSNKPMDTKSAPAMSNANSAMTNSANSTANMPAANMSSAPSNPANVQMPDTFSASNANKPAVQPAATPPIPREALRDEEKNSAVPNDSSIQLDGASGEDKPQVKQEKDDELAKVNKADADKKLNEQQPVTNLPQASRAAKNLGKLSEKPKTATTDSTSGEGMTSTVGGKTFTRRNNVWYDKDYNNQATTNVTRGTSDYKKLDKDLRVIVENLGGTVVIVWKNRAYRIR
jgi:Putative zinc-finger